MPGSKRNCADVNHDVRAPRSAPTHRLLGILEGEVDWEITAQLRFRNTGLGGITTNNCRTSAFTITISGGDWGDVTSDPFTIPVLSGSGSGGCNGSSANVNDFFDLGVSGATLTLYKFVATEDATGDPLTGS